MINDKIGYGERLRLAREAKGLSVDSVAEKLRLNSEVVRALEQEDQDQMPATAFVRGYIRTYSQLLAENADDLINLYNMHAKQDPSLTPVERVESLQQDNGLMLRWGTVIVTLVLLLLAAVWLYDFMRNQSEAMTDLPDLPEIEVTLAEEPGLYDSPVAGNSEEMDPLQPDEGLPSLLSGSDDGGPELREPDSSTVSQSPSESEQLLLLGAPESVSPSSELGISEKKEVNTIAPRGSDQLQLIFSGQSWVEAVDANGYRLIYGMFDASDDGLSVRGQAPFRVIVGDVNQVKLKINNSEYELDSYRRSNNTARVLLGDDR